MEDVQLSFVDFILNHAVLTAIFIITLYITVVGTIKIKLSKVKIITPMDLALMVNHGNAVVLDVRQNAEFVQGHITNSVNVIESEIIGDNLGRSVSDKTRAVILIDKDGTKNYELGNQLVKNGYSDVSALKNGILAWQQSGLPLVTGNK